TGGGVNAIDPSITLLVTATQATATVQPLANLAAGTYTGRIQFLACSDQACNNRIGGTPLPVNYTVNVLNPVRAAPAAVTQTVVSGTGLTQDVAVTLGASEIGYSLIINGPVQVSDVNNAGFRLSIPSLPVGVYNASIQLTGSAGSRSTLPIT